MPGVVCRFSFLDESSRRTGDALHCEPAGGPDPLMSYFLAFSSGTLTRRASIANTQAGRWVRCGTMKVRDGIDLPGLVDMWMARYAPGRWTESGDDARDNVGAV